MKGMLGKQPIIKRPKRRLKRLLKRISPYGGGFRAGVFLAAFILLIAWRVGASRSFAIQKIEVVGRLKHLSAEEVQKATGVHLEENLFHISLSTVENNVLKLPWVRSVSVRRQVPETLWIHIKEHQPLALVLKEQLYFLSEDGLLFKKVENETMRDLPVVTGIDEKNLQEVVQLLIFFRQLSDFEVFGLSEIHYNDAIGYSIVTLSGPMEIRLGRDDFETKIRRLKKIWAAIEPRFQRVHGIDLNYEDRAFVKL